MASQEKGNVDEHLGNVIRTGEVVERPVTLGNGIDLLVGSTVASQGAMHSVLHEAGVDKDKQTDACAHERTRPSTERFIDEQGQTDARIVNDPGEVMNATHR